MSNAEILGWITQVVQDELDNDEISLTMDTVPSDVEGWDSMAHVGIVLAIEGRVGRPFTIDQIESVQTVGDLVRLAGENQAA